MSILLGKYVAQMPDSTFFYIYIIYKWENVLPCALRGKRSLSQP